LLEKNEKKMRQQLVAISRPGETQRASPTNTIQTLTLAAYYFSCTRVYYSATEPTRRYTDTP